MADTGHDECGIGAVTVSDNLGFFFSPQERNGFVLYLLLAKASKQTERTATVGRWDPRPAGRQQHELQEQPRGPRGGRALSAFLGDLKRKGQWI